MWINLDPQAGHKQMGWHPALVVRNNTFNTAAMLCPITNTDRAILIQIKLDERTKTSGVVMREQVKILDLQKRKAEFIEQTPEELIAEAMDMISGFVETIN